MTTTITGATGVNQITDDAITDAKLPAGSVLQVVNASYSTDTVSTSSTFAATGLTATITPSSTSSKILVAVSQGGVYKDTNATQGVGIKLISTGSLSVVLSTRAAGDVSGIQSVGNVSGSVLDSPNTTSAVTYSTVFNSTSNANNVYVQVYSATSTITLMEIAG